MLDSQADKDENSCCQKALTTHLSLPSSKPPVSPMTTNHDVDRTDNLTCEPTRSRCAYKAAATLVEVSEGMKVKFN